MFRQRWEGFTFLAEIIEVGTSGRTRENRGAPHPIRPGLLANALPAQTAFINQSRRLGPHRSDQSLFRTVTLPVRVKSGAPQSGPPGERTIRQAQQGESWNASQRGASATAIRRLEYPRNKLSLPDTSVLGDNLLLGHFLQPILPQTHSRPSAILIDEFNAPCLQCAANRQFVDGCHGGATLG
jgi:hypothetical protein